MVIPLADNFNHGDFTVTYQRATRDQLMTGCLSRRYDFSDFHNQISQKQFTPPPKQTQKNRLQKYLEAHSELPIVNSIWELQQALKSYQSSSDSQNVSESQQEDDIERTLQDIQRYYFMIVIGRETSFKAGEQVFTAYGRLNNRNLLLDYGFAMPRNRYDKLVFKMWNHHSGKSGLVTITDIKSNLANSNFNKKVSPFYLKKGKFNHFIFTYFRRILPRPAQNKPFLVASPSNIDCELSILQSVFQIYYRIQSDFSTSLQEDLQIQPSSSRHLHALTYRIQQKEILKGQLELLETLKSTLISLTEGRSLDFIFTHTDQEETKKLYPLRDYLKSLRANLFYS